MYSICTNFFPNNKDAMVGYIEAVTGVGLILGPLIGSILFSVGGYIFIFYSFGSLFIISSLSVNIVFTEDIDAIGKSSTNSERGSSTNSSMNDDEYHSQTLKGYSN